MNQPTDKKKSWKQVFSHTIFTVFGKVSCFTFLIAAGSALLGLLLDNILGTRPWLMIILFIVSFPFSMFAIYYVVKTSMPASLTNKKRSTDILEEPSRDKDAS